MKGKVFTDLVGRIAESLATEHQHRPDPKLQRDIESGLQLLTAGLRMNFIQALEVQGKHIEPDERSAFEKGYAKPPPPPTPTLSALNGLHDVTFMVCALVETVFQEQGHDLPQRFFADAFKFNVRGAVDFALRCGGHLPRFLSQMVHVAGPGEQSLVAATGTPTAHDTLELPNMASPQRDPRVLAKMFVARMSSTKKPSAGTTSLTGRTSVGEEERPVYPDTPFMHDSARHVEQLVAKSVQAKYIKFSDRRLKSIAFADLQRKHMREAVCGALEAVLTETGYKAFGEENEVHRSHIETTIAALHGTVHAGCMFPGTGVNYFMGDSTEHSQAAPKSGHVGFTGTAPSDQEVLGRLQVLFRSLLETEEVGVRHAAVAALRGMAGSAARNPEHQLDWSEYVESNLVRPVLLPVLTSWKDRGPNGYKGAVAALSVFAQPLGTMKTPRSVCEHLRGVLEAKPGAVHWAVVREAFKVLRHCDVASTGSLFASLGGAKWLTQRVLDHADLERLDKSDQKPELSLRVAAVEALSVAVDEEITAGEGKSLFYAEKDVRKGLLHLLRDESAEVRCSLLGLLTELGELDRNPRAKTTEAAATEEAIAVAAAADGEDAADAVPVPANLAASGDLLPGSRRRP